MLELLVEPVAPFSPLVVAAVLPGVVDDVLLEVLGEVDSVALPLVVPVAPIEDVVPGVVLLVVVSVLLLVLPVVVLGEVLPLRLPEPVVVDGVVLPVVVLLELAPVPLEPVVALSVRWHALSDRAAAMAIAMAVYWVFIRTP